MVFSIVANMAAFVTLAAEARADALNLSDINVKVAEMEPSEKVWDYHIGPQHSDERRRNAAINQAGTLSSVVTLTDADKERFVDDHNMWRNRAAGGTLNKNVIAAHMPQVYWDEELAESAEKYAKECRWVHSKPAGLTTLPYDVGENLYTGNKIDAAGAAMTGWGEEHTIYDHTTNTCTPNAQHKMCGHYQQVVWDKTTRLGCAWVKCSDVSGLNPLPGNADRDYVICQYLQPAMAEPNSNPPKTDKPYKDATVPGIDCDKQLIPATGTDPTYTNMCNNPNDICTVHNRCTGAQPCVSDTPVGGHDSKYTCEPAVCTFTEVNLKQVKNASPFLGGPTNGMFKRDGNEAFFTSDLDGCKKWCFMNRMATPACVGCSRHNTMPNVWFPVTTVADADREDSPVSMVVMDCPAGNTPAVKPNPTPPPPPPATPTAVPTHTPTAVPTDLPPSPTPVPTNTPTTPFNPTKNLGKWPPPVVEANPTIIKTPIAPPPTVSTPSGFTEGATFSETNNIRHQGVTEEFSSYGCEFRCSVTSKCEGFEFNPKNNRCKLAGVGTQMVQGQFPKVIAGKRNSGNTATKCADEGGTCTCTGEVYYGNAQFTMTFQELLNNPHVTKVPTGGSVTCNVAEMGGADPMPNRIKVCFCVA